MDHGFVAVGRALAAPARAAMLALLLDGQPHSAGELAAVAGVASPTASEHLAVLVESGLVSVQRVGRQRLFALSDQRVATALEMLSRPEAPAPSTSLRRSREQRRLREARTCYDHLAGRLGVALLDALVAKRWVMPDVDAVPAAGVAGFAQVGIDIAALRAGRRTMVRPCLDWTERRAHLAGSLGAALAGMALDQRWVARQRGSRGLTITPAGRSGLAAWGVRL